MTFIGILDTTLDATTERLDILKNLFFKSFFCFIYDKNIIFREIKIFKKIYNMYLQAKYSLFMSLMLNPFLNIDWKYRLDR